MVLAWLPAHRPGCHVEVVGSKLEILGRWADCCNMWQEVELHTDSKQNMDLVSIGLSVSAGSINAKFPGFSLYFISN